MPYNATRYRDNHETGVAGFSAPASRSHAGTPTLRVNSKAAAPRKAQRTRRTDTSQSEFYLIIVVSLLFTMLVACLTLLPVFLT